MALRDKRQWIVRLWRIVFLFFGFIALVSGGISWMLTGDLQSMFLTICALVLVISGAYSIYTLFSVNIFRKRIWKFQSRLERLFVYLCALGLYSSVVAAIIFATSFVCLRVLQIPGTITLAMIGVELALFSVVGYIGFTRLRRNMRWLSETGQIF